MRCVWQVFLRRYCHIFEKIVCYITEDDKKWYRDEAIGRFPPEPEGALMGRNEIDS